VALSPAFLAATRYGDNLAISTSAAAILALAAVSATDPSANALAALAAATTNGARAVSSAVYLSLALSLSMTALSYCASTFVLAASGAVMRSSASFSAFCCPAATDAPIVVSKSVISYFFAVLAATAVALSLVAINTLAFKSANSPIAVSCHPLLLS